MGRAQTRVAAAAKDPVVIYGFAVLEPGLIHMVYVRRPWRKMGIARALLSGLRLEDCDWSTQSSDFREWIRHKWTLRHYRPFWADEGNVYG
jgi:GNAT superfamily N-acetyltransferase